MLRGGGGFLHRQRARYPRAIRSAEYLARFHREPLSPWWLVGGSTSGLTKTDVVAQSTRCTCERLAPPACVWVNEYEALMLLPRGPLVVSDWWVCVTPCAAVPGTTGCSSHPVTVKMLTNAKRTVMIFIVLPHADQSDACPSVQAQSFRVPHVATGYAKLGYPLPLHTWTTSHGRS